MSISEQSHNVTDVSQKDELSSDRPHETGHHRRSTYMEEHDDNSVAFGVVSSVVKPAQAKHPGAIPKKRTGHVPQSPDSEDSNVQQTPMTTASFSNLFTASDLVTVIDSSLHKQVTSKPTHLECKEPPSTCSKFLQWNFQATPDKYRESDDISFNRNQGVIYNESTEQISATGQDPIMQSGQLRPPSPEEGNHSPRNVASLVTGRSLLLPSVAGVARSEKLNYQQSRNPAEHNDELGIYGQVLKENETLRATTTYLLEENKTLKQGCEKKCLENLDLKQQLEASTAESVKQLEQNAVLEEENGKLKNSLNEHELMIADNHDMIQKSQKMLLWKSQECDSLKETVRNLRMVVDQLVCRNRGFRNTMENEERKSDQPTWERGWESDYLVLPGSASFNLLQDTRIDMDNRNLQQLAERTEPSIPECNDSSPTNYGISGDDISCGVGVDGNGGGCNDVRWGVGVDGDGCGCGSESKDCKCGVDIDGDGGGDGRCDVDGNDDCKCGFGVGGDGGGGGSNDGKCGVSGDYGGGSNDGKCGVDGDYGGGSNDGKCGVDGDDGGGDDGKCGVDGDYGGGGVDVAGGGSDNGKRGVDNDGGGSNDGKCGVVDGDGSGSDGGWCGVRVGVDSGGSSDGKHGVGVDGDGGRCGIDGAGGVDVDDRCGIGVVWDGGGGGGGGGRCGVVDGVGGSSDGRSAVDWAGGGVGDDRCGVGVIRDGGGSGDGRCGVIDGVHVGGGSSDSRPAVDWAGGGFDDRCGVGVVWDGGGSGDGSDGRSAVDWAGGGFVDRCGVGIVWDGGGDNAKSGVGVNGDSGGSNDGKCDVDVDGDGDGDGRCGVSADVDDGSSDGNRCGVVVDRDSADDVKCNVGVDGNGSGGDEDGKIGVLGSVGASNGGGSSWLPLKLVAAVKPFHKNDQFQGGITNNSEDHNSLLDLGPGELQEGDLC